MKEIEVTIGNKEINTKGEVVKYNGGETDNGICYKDLDAWQKGEGVIYISEYGLDADDTDEHWTKKSWLAWVKDACECEGIPTDEDFIEYIAECILHECDWQDLSTMLEEIDLYENFVDFKKN